MKGQKKKEGKKGIKDTRGNGQREKEKQGTKKQKTTKKPKNTNPYEKNQVNQAEEK